MVWGLFRTKKVKPAAGKTGYWRTVWRRVRDSNPRSLSGHSISSAAPSTTRTTLQGLSQHQNYLGKRGELMGRTSKNIKFRIPEKPRKIKGFRNGGFPIATMISSDAPSTSRTTLRAIFQPNFSNLNLGKWREKLERKLFNLFNCTAKTPINQGFSRRGFQSDHWFSSLLVSVSTSGRFVSVSGRFV